MQTLIVFSHLRWDFVYQRPQHLLSRLAKHYKVLFFEEPVRGKQTPFLQRIAPCANLEVLRPHTTVDAVGFHDDQLPELTRLLAEYLRDFSIKDYVVWFYTPMALPLLADLKPQAVIYDCMDELSAFTNAPRQMVQREKELLQRAQLVLTGGPSLYEAKRGLHKNVHCFPSAVDAEHFSPHTRGRKRAQYKEEADHLHASIPHPRLGFFGVIDERFDAELVTAISDAAPNWQFVMAGPVVKIDPASLPNRPNVHWLGQQPYEVLPHLVSHWDVCLLPFARNESTRFISPTKTLEYMAAEKPIVSTPIHDVMSLYGNSVSIAATAEEFMAACAEALTDNPANRKFMVERMRNHVSQCTWDHTALEIRDEIEDVLQRQPVNAVNASELRSSTSRIAGTLRLHPVDRSVNASAEAMPSVAAQ